jgi:hypothetical protein
MTATGEVANTSKPATRQLAHCEQVIVQPSEDLGKLAEGIEARTLVYVEATTNRRTHG